MTLYQFNKLPETEQFNMLLSEGVLIAKRKETSFKFVLYQLGKIYIELKYYPDHKAMPDLRGFTSTGRSLLPYLSQIDLSELGLERHSR